MPFFCRLYDNIARQYILFGIISSSLFILELTLNLLSWSKVINDIIQYSGKESRIFIRCWLMMGYDPLVWYYHPVTNGVWARETDNAFGAYTPCAIDSIVGNASHLVLWTLYLYRIWLIKMNLKIQKFCLRSNFYNYVLALFACCCAVEPLLRLVRGISIFNLDEEMTLAPYEMCNTCFHRFMLWGFAF